MKIKKSILYMLSAVAWAFVLLIVIPSGNSFAATTYPLTVGTGNGFTARGTVTSQDGQVNCGSACTDNLDASNPTTVLTFHPNPGITFGGWDVQEGSCAEGTSSATCTFTGTANQGSYWIEPYWYYADYTLSVTKTGTGSGTVTGEGLSCGSTCSATHSFNGQSQAAVSLVASPADGSVFGGWAANSDTCYIDTGVGKDSNPTLNPNPDCSSSVHTWQQLQTFHIYAIFNKAPAASSAQTSSSSGSSTASSSSSSAGTAATASSANTPPASPTVSTIEVAGKKVSDKKPIKISSNQPLVLSGTTIPNGIVTLTIHSKPRTVTVTADKSGNWSYTITGLPPGNHYVEASTQNPSTKQSSKPTKILSFAVTAAKLPATATKANTPVSHGSHTGLYILLVVVLVVLIGTTAGWYRYGRKWWQSRKHAAGADSPRQGDAGQAGSDAGNDAGSDADSDQPPKNPPDA